METKMIVGHLREIRRYWPKAKYVETRLEQPVQSLWIEYAPGRRCSERLFGRSYSGLNGWCGWSVRAERQATISEAMRASGFGVRPQCAVKGYHFAATRRIEAEVRLIMHNWRASVGRAPTPVEWWLGSLYRLPALVSTQRPHKGARLGRRKRNPPKPTVDLAKLGKWYDENCKGKWSVGYTFSDIHAELRG